MTTGPAYYIERNLKLIPCVFMKFNWHNKTLLIIEDDYVSYLYLKDVLSNTRIKIKRAVSVKQAQTLLASKNKIDLIIVNVNILGKNIYKSILEIKSFNQLIPIIAITNQYSMDTQTECIESGCDTYIYSNIDSSQLLLSIDELLDKSMIISSLLSRDKS
jgi:DNA-binding response OmpR family regulator